MASKKKQAGRHRKQAARHRKVVARNRKRAARNGIFAAAVGLSLAVGVGQGVAAASTDGGSSDSGSAPQSSNNSGSNSRHSATPNRTNASAGPARTRSTGKQPAANSNSGSSVSVRSSGSARPVVADADATDATTQPTTSTTTPSSTGSTSTPAPSTTDGTVTPETSATGGTSTPPPADSTTTTTTAVVTPNPTTAKSTSARAAVAPSAAAYSMNGDLTAVQDGAGPITTPAHYDIQTTLDAWAAQLDALMVAPLTSVNGWLKFPVTFLNAFFKPSIVVDRLSYGLNGLATLMDEFVPPFKMVDGAPSTITQASVTAAVLAGAIVLFNTSQTVDIQHWIDEAVSLAGALQDIAANPVVNGLTANDMDGVIGAARAAFLSPKTVLDMTIDIGPAPNPVSLAMYVVVVAIFRRFADVATDHQPVVTDMQQTSQHLPNGSGTTVSGYVQFYDADGDPITSYGFTEPNDSRFTVTVVDGTNGRMNWTVWDWNPLSSDTSPKTLTFTMTVLAQGDGQISVSKPYMPNGNETQKTVTVTVYYNQAVGSMTNTVGSTSPMGVVRGTVSAPQNPDNPMTYSLNGASGGSAYTANGGIVKLNPTTGAYVYTPNRASGATSDSFQLTSTDSFGHTYTTTVSVPVSATSPVTTNASVPGKVTGNLNINGADTGLMTYSIGTAPNALRGTVVLNADGTFTYTRTAAGHTQPTQDSFTILGTDSTGKTTTVAVVNVNPTVSNSAPVGNGVTVGSSSLTRVIGPNDQQDTSGTLKATDADGDTVTWAAGTYSTAQGGSITVNANGTFSYTIQKYAWFGVSDSYWHDHAVTGDPGDTFTINVSDAFGGTTAVTYGIPIEKQNAAPTLSGSVSSSNTSGLGVVRGTIANGSDGDGDGLTYTLVGTSGGSVYGSNGGIVTMSGTSFTYIPKSGITSDTFQVQVSDNHGGVTTATVTLTGLTTPSPQTNTNTTAGVTTGSLNVPAGDTGLGLTYSLGAGPSKGSVIVNSNGTYTYTRTAGLGHTVTPNDSFTIKATDATGKSVIIATINVAPSVSNNAPALTVNGVSGTGGSATTAMSAPGSYNTGTFTQTLNGITITYSDADGDSLYVNNKYDGTGTAVALAPGATITTANGGTVTVNANGTLSYSITKANVSYYHAAARIGASGTTTADWFNVTVTDGYGGTSTVTVTVPVWAVNSSPTMSTNSPACGFGTCTVTATMGDPDGDSLSGSLNTSNDGTGNPWYTLSRGSVTINSGNQHTFSWTGNSNGAGTQNTGIQTYTVYDGYYRVVNGVIDNTYPTRVWKTWNNTSTSTGN
ncbi:Outer membrane adhesin like proteiin (modular protein) [uncultured Mycobacterium sp.]|uniref:Outer membrane adhesin like proteiin (Modular protein) n=1 Tax=uncultured Mycobacterium sp. TaxID=171292 RepID=A0A1Y5PIC5_9MYCO|nr:Outer membrane adhesin like proteiin (modular protein) [uncultured Mycobacterium sp.]